MTVDEDEIASAILVLLEREKTLAEGAGATALAALLQKKTSLNGAHTAVMVCGGNIDVTLLIADHRTWSCAGWTDDPATDSSAG